VRSAEGKESEVQEGVCGGWYFVLATEREVPGGGGGDCIIPG